MFILTQLNSVNFPCGSKLERPEKTNDFRQNVSDRLFSHVAFFVRRLHHRSHLWFSLIYLKGLKTLLPLKALPLLTSWRRACKRALTQWWCLTLENENIVIESLALCLKRRTRGFIDNACMANTHSKKCCDSDSCIQFLYHFKWVSKLFIVFHAFKWQLIEC